MWQAIAPVTSDYDTIVYEGGVSRCVTVINTGPASVRLRAWHEFSPAFSKEYRPEVELEMRRGDIRTVSGRLVRTKLLPNTGSFAAIGWSVNGTEG